MREKELKKIDLSSSTTEEMTCPPKTGPENKW
jgi:hypothetical protein